MALGRFIEQSIWSVACKNDNSANLHFLIVSPHPYYDSFQSITLQLCLSTFLKFLPLSIFLNSLLEHNSAAVRNISMILGRITEQVSAKCCMQE